MPSLGARSILLLMQLLKPRRAFASPEAVTRHIQRVRRIAPARPGASLHKHLRITAEACLGHEVYRLSPRAQPASAAPSTPADGSRQLVVMYLHGGGYVLPVNRFYWHFIAKLAHQTGAAFIVPLYPLAPEHSGLAALNFVREVYLREMAKNHEVLLIGSSAGAGLALALAASLRDHGEVAPRHLVLMTPWVDVAIPHPEAEQIAPHDPMLALPGLRECGRLYAGDLPTSHPVISPAKGDLSGLPPMTIYAATNDILAPDAVAMAHKVRAQGGKADLKMGVGMTHGWPFLGAVPEARQARAEIEAIVRAAAAAVH